MSWSIWAIAPEVHFITWSQSWWSWAVNIIEDISPGWALPIVIQANRQCGEIWCVVRSEVVFFYMEALKSPIAGIKDPSIEITWLSILEKEASHAACKRLTISIFYWDECVKVILITREELISKWTETCWECVGQSEDDIYVIAIFWWAHSITLVCICGFKCACLGFSELRKQ